MSISTDLKLTRCADRLQRERFSTKVGDKYTRTVYTSLVDYTSLRVRVTRTTANFIYFSDGVRITKTTGKVANPKHAIVSYAPVCQ